VIGPGRHPVPGGHVAMVVTYLEMTGRAAPRPAAPPEGAEVTRWERPPLDAYRDLMRLVGSDWLWSNRLKHADGTLAAAIHDPEVEVWHMVRDGVPLGIAEVDFRKGTEAELAFFGVAPELVGSTAARCLMNVAIARAWSRPIGRFHLHTCTLDHPAALAFYRRSGFTAYKRAVEVVRDPRLDGILPRDAAPHVAILE